MCLWSRFFLLGSLWCFDTRQKPRTWYRSDHWCLLKNVTFRILLAKQSTYHVYRITILKFPTVLASNRSLFSNISSQIVNPWKRCMGPTMFVCMHINKRVDRFLAICQTHSYNYRRRDVNKWICCCSMY